MDLYNIFHVYFVSEPIILVYLLPFKDNKVFLLQNKKYHVQEKEYGSYMNNKFVPSENSNWKLLKIQSFL